MLHDIEYLEKNTLKQHEWVAMRVALGTVSCIPERPPVGLCELQRPLNRQNDILPLLWGLWLVFQPVEIVLTASTIWIDMDRDRAQALGTPDRR